MQITHSASDLASLLPPAAADTSPTLSAQQCTVWTAAVWQSRARCARCTLYTTRPLVHPLLWQPACCYRMFLSQTSANPVLHRNLIVHCAAITISLQTHFWHIPHSASNSSQTMLNFAPFFFLSVVYNPPCRLVTLTTVRNGVISNNDERLSKM